MGVPIEIREVERPVNTVVIDTGSSTNKRYVVRERSGITYIKNGNPQPHNGRVIGYIINHEFVPVRSKVASNGADMLHYGTAALVKTVSNDLYEDLLKVFSIGDATTIMAIASLKVAKHGIKYSRLKGEYQSSYISLYYPGAAISKNSVCSLLKDIGMDSSKRKDFYDLRFQRVKKDHHLAVDATLKEDSSKVNTLSDMSYKFRLKGVPDISVLYCFDIEDMDPVCSEVFPGNCIDAKAYPKFIKDNDIRKGILINDKGFPPDAIRKELKERPDLHYLTPIKRDDKRIKEYNLLQMDQVVRGLDKRVLAKKCKTKEGTYLYAFKDVGASTHEAYSFIDAAIRKNSFNSDKYKEKEETFGVIVLESDYDMTVEEAYLSYESRWDIELVFKYYKSDIELSETNVQSDFSVIGSEFINFISTVITCRILKKARKARVLENSTYGDMLDDLSQVWRSSRCPIEESPSIDDEFWFSPIKKNNELMVSLGLAKSDKMPTKGKRGRPRKNPVETPEAVETPKRKRGRPRKLALR